MERSYSLSEMTVMAGTDLRKALQPLSRRLRRLMRSFARSQDGNILVFTGLAIVPMMISIGAGIDYSRALSTQAQLQAAADSTILTLAQIGDAMTPSQLQAQARQLPRRYQGAEAAEALVGLKLRRRGIAQAAPVSQEIGTPPQVPLCA